MNKRSVKIGTYDTAVHEWLLSELEFSAPAQVTSYVDVPGRRKGPLDMSTVLTDGDPVYGSRTLTATFESSEGDRLTREDRISNMMNDLDGMTHHIVIPDDPHHFIVGRVHVERLYNDPAHASVRLTAVCEPWRYNEAETVASFAATTVEDVGHIINAGRLAVVPTVTVSGGTVRLTIGSHTHELSAGSYYIPDAVTPRGGLEFRYSGSGIMTFTYREAVL